MTSRPHTVQGRANNVTIEVLCSVMVNTELGSPVMRYAAVNKLMSGNESLDCNYKSLINEMSTTDWSHPLVMGGGEKLGVALKLIASTIRTRTCTLIVTVILH